MFCTQCETPLTEAAKFCASCGASARSDDSQDTSIPVTASAGPSFPGPSIETQTKLRGFSNLTKWLIRLLYLSVMLDTVAVTSGILQHQFLTEINAGTYSSLDVLTTAAETNDTRQQIIVIFKIALYIVTAIFFLKWIFRAGYNAHKISVLKMKFTPGWSVWGYFIPVGNLCKPYQAMKEIYAASKDPLNRYNRLPDLIFPLSWLFFILSSVLGNTAFRLMTRAKEINEFIVATNVSVASDLTSIASAFVAIILVRRIYRMQAANFYGSLTEYH
jgi:Domain of unknown function (DUF4328)